MGPSPRGGAKLQIEPPARQGAPTPPALQPPAATQAGAPRAHAAQGGHGRAHISGERKGGRPGDSVHVVVTHLSTSVELCSHFLFAHGGQGNTVVMWKREGRAESPQYLTSFTQFFLYNGCKKKIKPSSSLEVGNILSER